MKNLKESFASKKFRYGTFSTLTAIAVIALLVVVNLVVERFPMKYDLTKDKRYSISEQTTNVLDRLTEDVRIYPLFATGQEYTQFVEILDQYAARSPHITVTQKDPDLYPTFVAKYQKNDEAIPANSIVVESDKRFKVIKANELYTQSMNYQTYQYDLTSIDIEPKVTNAIQYVLQDNTPMIYALAGHNEIELPASYQAALKDVGYEYGTINLLLEEAVPEDCQILFIATPAKDISQLEAEKITKYLENNGKAMFFLDYVPYDLTNLRSILVKYGVDLGQYYISEGDANYHIPNENRVILPHMQSHDITNILIEKKYPQLVFYATGIDTQQNRKDSLEIIPVLTTSNQAFGKNSAEAASINKEPGDVDGPFNLAVAIKDSFYVGDDYFTTQLFVMGTTSILDDAIDYNYVGGGNSSFVLNCANWLAQKEETIYVPSKAPSTSIPLSISQQQSTIISVFAIGVIPVAIFGAGLGVWLRRRNK